MVYPNHIMQPLKLKQICINLDGCSWYFFNLCLLFFKESLKKMLSEKNEPKGNKTELDTLNLT